MDERLVIRFDGPPGPTAGRFIEVELGGKSVSYGEWEQDGEDWLLVLPDADAKFAQLEIRLEILKGHLSLAPVGPHQFVTDYEEWRLDGEKLRLSALGGK